MPHSHIYPKLKFSFFKYSHKLPFFVYIACYILTICHIRMAIS